MELCQNILPHQGRRQVIGHLFRDAWVLQCLLASDLKNQKYPTDQMENPPPQNKTPPPQKKTKEEQKTSPPQKKIPQQTTTKKMYYINRRLQEPLLPDPTLQHDGKRTLPFWPNTIRHRNVLDMTVLYPW